MKKLDISKNQLIYHSEDHGEAVGKLLGDLLATNTVLTELNLSNRGCGAVFAMDVAVGIRTNRTLTSLNVSGNNMGAHVRSDYVSIPDLSGINALATAISECT